MSSLSLSSIKDITNLASVSIANIDLLTNKQGQPSSQGLSQVQIQNHQQSLTLLVNTWKAATTALPCSTILVGSRFVLFFLLQEYFKELC